MRHRAEAVRGVFGVIAELVLFSPVPVHCTRDELRVAVAVDPKPLETDDEEPWQSPFSRLGNLAPGVGIAEDEDRIFQGRLSVTHQEVLDVQEAVLRGAACGQQEDEGFAVAGGHKDLDHFLDHGLVKCAELSLYWKDSHVAARVRHVAM